MNKREWLLIALNPRMAPIQAQKSLFKFAMESGAPARECYQFIPYNWGPCSFEIYDDLGQLRADGLIEFEPAGPGWNSYHVTESGSGIVDELRRRAEPKLLTKMDDIRQWVAVRTFDRLLRDVYSQYPEFAERSLFNK